MWWIGIGPGTSYSSNQISGEVVITTSNYIVHVSLNARSLVGSYVTSPSGQILYKFDSALNNSVWLPGPAENPAVLSFADTLD